MEGRATVDKWEKEKKGSELRWGQECKGKDVCRLG